MAPQADGVQSPTDSGSANVRSDLINGQLAALFTQSQWVTTAAGDDLRVSAWWADTAIPDYLQAAQ
jgi:hypothetical protein